MRVLLLNQCFHPDVMATAQYLTDLAVELAQRGHQVTVLASRRGYDDPTQRFRARESWRGIDIVRIPSLALGKANKWWRLVDFGTYLIICFVRLMFLPRQDLTVALTAETLGATTSERQGRIIDFDGAGSMERKKQEGYF
jgi:hypothetical protein